MIFDYDELTQRRDGLKRLLIGFRMMLASPDTSPEVKAELEEERIKNEAEIERVNAWIKATDELLSGGYPEHRLGIASPEIVAAIKALAETATLVPGDYQNQVLTANSGIISAASEQA